MTPFYFFHKGNKKLIFSNSSDRCNTSAASETGHVGGLLAPLNVRARLVESSCIVKQSHYIMRLICFINIRRMFQFPPVNRISADLKLRHWDRNITKKNTKFRLYSVATDFIEANLYTVSSLIFFLSFISLGKRCFLHSVFFAKTSTARSSCLWDPFCFQVTFRVFFRKSKFYFWHLSPY